MTIAHAASLRNAMADLVDTTVNTGSGTAKFRLLTAGDVVIYSWDLSDPAFGAASTGTITLTDPGLEQALDGGTVTKFELNDKDAANVITGTVSASGGGGDLEVSNATVVVGQDATLTFTWTAPV